MTLVKLLAMQHTDWQGIALVIAAIGTAAASIIAAIRGEAAKTRSRVDQHEAASENRARELKTTVLEEKKP